MFSRESNKAQFGPKEYRHLNSLRRQQNATEPAWNSNADKEKD